MDWKFVVEPGVVLGVIALVPAWAYRRGLRDEVSGLGYAYPATVREHGHAGPQPRRAVTCERSRDTEKTRPCR
jgi:hypothetical protein